MERTLVLPEPYVTRLSDVLERFDKGRRRDHKVGERDAVRAHGDEESAVQGEGRRGGIEGDLGEGAVVRMQGIGS